MVEEEEEEEEEEENISLHKQHPKSRRAGPSMPKKNRQTQSKYKWLGFEIVREYELTSDAASPERGDHIEL